MLPTRTDRAQRPGFRVPSNVLGLVIVMALCNAYLVLTAHKGGKSREEWVAVERRKREVWAVYRGDSGGEERWTSGGSPRTVVGAKRGQYTSTSRETVGSQFGELEAAGVDGILLQWMPPGRSDVSEGCLEVLFQEAEKHQVCIGVIIQNYENRTTETIVEDIREYVRKWGNHSRVLTRDGKPVVMVYDAQNEYGVPLKLWKTGERVYLIATGTKMGEFAEAIEWGFDSVTNYFVQRQFHLRDEEAQWGGLAQLTGSKGVEFFPAVGPGYNDTNLRSWNTGSVRGREGGSWYMQKWGEAIELRVAAVIINSYNDFGEGTNIEASVPLNGLYDTDFIQLWGSRDPGFYMDLTQKQIGIFKGLDG